MDFLRICVVFLISLLPMMCSGQFEGECIGSLLSEDDGFRNCTYTILPVIQETLLADQGGRPQGAVLLESLCSEDVRPSLDCFVNTLSSKCPDDLADVISGIGIDPVDYFEFGGFDLPCSVFVGECTSVKNCVPQIRLDLFASGVGGIAGEIDPLVGGNATNMTEEMQFNFTTPLTEFYGLKKYLCGFMKPEYDCAMTEFDKCSDSIVESLDRQVPLFVVDILIADSRMNFSVLGDDIVSLLENDCPSTNVQILTNSCSLVGLDTQQFVRCHDNAMNGYENDNNGCILQDVLTYCTQRHIGDTCNEVALTYLVEQIPQYLRLNGMECTRIIGAPVTTTDPQLPVNGNGNVNPTSAGQNTNAASMKRYPALYLLLAISLYSSFLRLL